MAEESESPPLTRRVPGAARSAPAPAQRRVLSDELLQRMQAAVEAAQATRQASQEVAGDDMPDDQIGQPAREDPAAPGAEPVTEPLPVLRVALAGAPAQAGPADPEAEAAAALAGTADAQTTAAVHAAAASAEPPRQTTLDHGDAGDPDLIVLPERAAGTSAPARTGPPPGAIWPDAAGRPARAGSAARARPPASAGQPMVPAPVIRAGWPASASPRGGTGPRAADNQAATEWWVQQRPRRRVPGLRKYVVAGLAAAIVLVIAAAAGYVLSSQRARPPSSRGPGTVRQDPAAAARARAAAWVERQVSHAAVVSCDRAMCAALAADGFPAGRLRPIGSAARLLARSVVVVATPAIRRQFGGKLGAWWAPAVIARFGSAAAEVDIRVVAPHGAHAYAAALGGDQALRKAAGTALLGSRQIIASPTARKQLAAGEPDARLLIVITALAAQQPVHIEGFGNPGPRAGTDVPLRYADLAEMVAGSHLVRASYVHSVLVLLRAQHPPYRPARIQTLRLASGRLVLRICFLAPSPLGMFGPQSP